MRENLFIKVSGDLIKRPDVLQWIKENTARYHLLVCPGGGTQINEAFEEMGFTINFGPLGRETRHLWELQTARNILEENQAVVQDLLAEYGISAEVVPPFIYLGTVLCPVNGDEMVRLAYVRCARLLIFTYEDRAQDKKKQFKDLPKVEVVGFPRLT